MKPDGVATAAPEPVEAEGMEPIIEPTGNDGASQNGTTPSPPQPQNEKAAPATVKEAPGTAVDAKSKTKGPVRGKTTAAGPTSTGPGTRPKATPSRVANGVTKTAASTATKKPIPAPTTMADKKKPATAAGASGVGKKPVSSSAAVATSRAQPKATTVGLTNRTTTTATSGTKTAVTSLSRRPATAPTATKPKATAPAPKPVTAPAAKPGTSALTKTTTAPKTNRAPIGSSTARPGAISATGRTVTSATSSAVTKTSRTATQQPVKPLATASAARKDVGKANTTAPAKRTVAPTAARPTSSKPSNSDAPKPTVATKRIPPSNKAPQPKPDEKKSVPTRKVPPSQRTNPSRPATGKNTAASPSHRPAGSILGGKVQPSKPIQSVPPLVKGKPEDKEPIASPDDLEPASEPEQLSAAALTTVAVPTAAAITSEEVVSRQDTAPTAESSLEAPTSPLDVQENVGVQVSSINSQTVFGNLCTKPEDQEALFEAGPIEVVCPTSSAVIQKSEEQVLEHVEDKLIAAVAPVAQDGTEQEILTASPLDSPAATIASSVVEVAEKAEAINNDCYEDQEEEEKEGSQQVSLSEMSGTQPTEESRPGSAGLAGSVWRAGALLSELDSEDVSCSQQGASELSAPGVLEGTESMDDLGEASLKGADGEGASVGSPDFEKVPDILNNEDEDDDDYDDRVCDMEVGSERAEDSNRQHHDNEDDDDDEDVEMASEGITESGLESYGNADEDDLTEDYRLDNLNRIQPPPMLPSAPPATQWNESSCFADTWAQPPQPASTLLSSPSSECWQGDPETPTQAPAQARPDVSSEVGSSAPQQPNPFDSAPCSTRHTPPTAAEGHVSPKTGLTPSVFCQSNDIEKAPHMNKDASIPQEATDSKEFSAAETDSKGELPPEPLNTIPALLPDIMQDLGIDLEHADEDEEPETLPADVLGDPATAPSSSSATEDETSDTEGEMQISEPQAELTDTGGACVAEPLGHNLSTLEEREEMGGENEGGGGGDSDTPQSATSAASYGFDYMTSNSNAQSSAESCSKSPGIFSLENEEQLPDEATDPSLLKELTLIPAAASREKIDSIKSQQGEIQSHLEQQYMLCGESELPEPNAVPGTVPLDSGLTDSSSPQAEEEQDLGTQHPYYSTICEKTESPLAERNVHFQPQPNDLISIQMSMSSKLRLRPRAVHVNQPPRLPTDLPPRIPNVVSNMQLRCLEQHQQHLLEIQQRQEKRTREQERQEEEEEDQLKNGDEQQDEERRRHLLELQLQQQERELKQRQQIMQWQQELDQQQQQQKPKVHTPVVLSPSSGLSTIYESLEDEDEEKERHRVVEEGEDETSSNLGSKSSIPSPESTTQDIQQDLEEPIAEQTSPSPMGSPERPPPLEFDWGKKVDIVQQLINQTLLLAGDGCSPLLLLPGGAGGTLSPLESSLWPNLLPPLTPPSATVTSVSSFSPEAPGNIAQGEWTVVELETHH